MDDLLGEDWQSAPKQSGTWGLSNNAISASNYSSLRPSPQPVASTSTTPLNLSRPSSTLTGGPGRPATTTPKPSGDVFGSLVGLKGKAAGGASLSIQERQRQLAEERQRQLDEQANLWDTLGSGKADGKKQDTSTAEDVDDILAAFNKDAKVDNASHYPPPLAVSSTQASGTGTPVGLGQQHTQMDTFPEDDDTFGLSGLAAKSNGHVKANTADHDDILGDLGRPAIPPKRPTPAAAEDSSDSEHDWDVNVARSRSQRAPSPPQDKALAELVEMGFPTDNAKVALAKNGGDVQSSVGWLLQQAHEESRQKAREQQDGQSGGRDSPMTRGRESVETNSMRDRSGADHRRGQAGNDKDASQIAQDLGNKLFKSANSLWKASQKQMAKTMADFQQERDPAQPKWMQSSSSTGSSRDASQRRPGQSAHRQLPDHVTNEAALLDMPRHDLPVRNAKAARPGDMLEPNVGRSHSPALRERSARQTPSTTPPLQDKRPASKLTRQQVEEQSAKAYISPARRRKGTPQPEKASEPAPAPKTEPEVDLFSPAPIKAPSANGSASKVASQQRQTPTPVAGPRVPPRKIPPASSAALSTSAGHRKRGTDAFKRGDYAVAHESYTAALSTLPSDHPIVIVILSNRSLTALKTGDAKTAVSDADRAINIIGPGLGAGESIDVEGDAKKEMREFYGKALMRKAEALEHMEKWAEAGAVWRIAVEAGVGGSISLRGKDRCERAMVPKPASAPNKAKVVSAKPAVNKRPAATSTSTDAVRKLREANAAAERVDDEKFQLADQVDARLTAWKAGKADNLRALLQSLDTVLWASAGWKKVGMSDLVMANKVKIIYMKAIAKVHPDKIAQDASTEQRMISGAVFSTLNEAWDRFKKDNNL